MIITYYVHMIYVEHIFTYEILNDKIRKKTGMGVAIMPVPESKRRANAKWDKENMTVIGCKVRRELAEEFKAECKRRGTTVNAVFLAAMREFMGLDNQSAQQTDCD